MPLLTFAWITVVLLLVGLSGYAVTTIAKMTAAKKQSSCD